MIAAERDPGSVSIDDIVFDRRPVGVRIELNSAVAVVVDVVVCDYGVPCEA